MNPTPYVVGIDLGTSNSALSFWHRGEPLIRRFEIEQIGAPAQLVKRPLLPSVSYSPHEGELEAAGQKLPWEENGPVSSYVIGSWARERGTQVPDRVIVSAKSWLAYSQVDRRAAILPWQSELEPSAKCSPLAVLTSYLEHLRAAFEHDRSEAGEKVNLAEIPVILTVPASFDEVARNLTYEAAQAAGLGDITLLEEPQAAFYAWIAQREKDWRQEVQAGDIVLVCDVGGGTTDFSLIAVGEDKGKLLLERISVGDHLLLGGDNMDLALAHAVKSKLAAAGTPIDRWQLISLIGAARGAKERLLSDPAVDELPLAVAGKGSSLFAQTVATSLSRTEVLETIRDGFFPICAVDDLPKNRVATGLAEFGLPYASEPAISKHLARFFKRSRMNIDSDPKLKKLVGGWLKKSGLAGKDYILPSAVLFNGGVFNAEPLRERVFELLRSWNGGEPIKEIASYHLDLAVAHGAAYFGRAKATGEGIRIAAGTARSYYLGLESSALAVPGIEPEVKGLCVVPQGTEEGTHLPVAERAFGLLTGEPALFRFFSSAVRAGDRLGALVDDAPHELEETASLSVTLPPLAAAREGELVPVVLDAEVTEMGTLELYMKHVHSDQRWNVEFNVRPQY